METGQNAAQMLHGRIALDFLPQNVLLLRLGQPEEGLIFFDDATLQSLLQALEKAREISPRGLVICGANAAVFSLGLDPEMLAALSDSAAALALARSGRAALSLLESLPFPTLCAISGPCLGAGLELALACRRRIISTLKSSVLGFPGLKAGILPAFGGTGRLVQLVGLPMAGRMLLEEDVLRPAQALQARLVDEIAPIADLLERAVRLVLSDTSQRKSRMRLMDRFYTFSRQGRKIQRRRMEINLQASRRIFLPAARSALDSLFVDLQQGRSAGHEQQSKVFAETVTSPECRAALRIAFLAEQATTLGRQAERRVKHLRAVVVGAGEKGAGLAACFTRHDCALLLKDPDEKKLSAARSHVLSHLLGLEGLSEQEKSFLFNRLEIGTGLTGSEGNAGFAIEAVAEDMEVKKESLSQLCSLVPQDALIATSTVCLNVSELTAGLPCPDRVLGMHFISPAETSKLVEIVRARQTTDRTLVLAAALAVRLGKTPVVLKDSPGFLTERMLIPYFAEALLSLEQHALEDIESSMIRFGMRHGPFEALDESGLDHVLSLQGRLKPVFGQRMEGLEKISGLLAAGMKGKRAESGFYIYKDGKRSSGTDYRRLLGLANIPAAGGNAELFPERLLMRLVNEAIFCLDEGVAGKPGPEAAGQIDLASVLGAGFPVYQGGVLYYAESLGASAVLERMLKFQELFGERFSPAPGLRRRAEKKKSFYEG